MAKIFVILLFTTICLNFSKSETCGKIKYTSGLIVNGEEAKRGEFPFLVALWHIEYDKYFCGGSLITQKHALTASHCIHDKSRPRARTAEEILVILGRFNFKNRIETGHVQMPLKKIIMHEDWKINLKRYDADIALLVFAQEVQLSEYIHTVCLPTISESTALKEGNVVGYGVSERTDFTTPEDIPRKSNVKPLSNENCFLGHSELAQISSNRTFCASGENSGPCSGDSGGGLYVMRNSVWYLQGIVSASLLDQRRQCDVTVPAIYTNVALFATWIWNKIDGISTLELPCVYDFSDTRRDNPYYCAANIEIYSDDVLLRSTTGSHKDGQTNSEVKLLDLGPDDDSDPNREVHFIPNGIGALFPNLRILYIQSCKIKSLSRKNFQNFKQLSTISLTDNLIEVIDQDTFYDVPNLYSLRINDNKLKSIPLDLLINAPRLQHFIFDGNLLEEFDGDQLFRKNPLLKSLDLENNQLRKIKINLNSFKELVKVNFENNKCINARVGKGSSSTIPQLQEIINNSC